MPGASPRRARAARACRIAGPLLLTALLAPTATPARGDAAPWFPLERGGRWEYSLHRDHSYRPSDGPVDRTFKRGRVVLEVRETGDDAALREVREVSEEEPLGDGQASRSWRVQRWSDDAGLRLHEVLGSDGGTTTRYDPPLRFLPAAPAPGDRWRVGRIRDGSATAELTGEVLGYEDVTEGARTWKDCLKVRWSGPIEGKTQTWLGALDILEGRTERVAWLVRGIGAVREVTTTDAELALPEDRRAHTHEVMTRRLVDVRLPP